MAILRLKSSLRTLSFFPLAALIVVPWTMAAQTPGRQLLRGHVPSVVAGLPPAGTLTGAANLQLAISLPLRNPAELSNLLHEIYDPAGSNYHHYLTPEQFTERFGPTEQDYQAVVAFAEANGLHVSARHPNRVVLDVNGSAQDVGRALHTTFRTYRHPRENRTFYAPASEPSLDLGVPILHISGLDNYSLPQPRLKSLRAASSANALPNAGSGPGGSYRGNDFRAAYVPDTTLTGSGQIVGLLQFDGYTASDITYYENQAGLPNVPLQNILIDGASGNPSHTGGEVEVSLDIEMAISMAPGLSKIILYEAPNPSPFVDILNRMATDNQAKQLSCSWYVPGGAAEPAADIIFQQMAAQGQTFLNASGDDDAYTGLIDFPGDTPYITQVGGTTLTTSSPGGSWASETVWNWHNGIGSGGGISTQYPVPTWQTNISMTASGGSTTKRNTPDVAMTADNVYVRADGFDYNVGGTSCAAPLWSGFMALVNQQAVATGKPTVGFINPLVDTIGTRPGYTVAFHDITTGDNTRSGSPTKFFAVAGYDLCTGWGTPAGQKLIDAIANPEPLLITPSAGFSSIGGVGGPFTITSQDLSLTNTGTNALSWKLASTSPWLNTSLSNGTLTPGGPATIVTVSLNTAASNLVVGTYSALVWFTNLNDNFGQSRQFALNVISPPTIVVQPTNQAVLDGQTTTFNVGVTGGLPLFYQWQFNSNNLTDGGKISGSKTTNLTIANVSTNEVGSYTVIVTNFAGIAVSSNASLTIVPSPPVIIQQPANAISAVNGTVQFSVAVVGTKPFFYQWSFGTTNISGATNATLILTNVQFSDAGQYSVTITNIYGSTNSSAATLTVVPCDPPPAGLVNWWRAEGNATDSIGTNNGTLGGTAGFAAGEVGQAFTFDGSSGYVSIPDSPAMDSFTNSMTIELWMKSGQLTANSDWEGIVTKGEGSWRFMGTTFAKTVYFGATGVSPLDITGTRNVNDGQWHHVAAVYDGSTMSLYVDGTLDVSHPATGAISQDSDAVYLGGLVDPPSGHNYSFNGMLDEISIYNRALSSNEIATIYNTSLAGKCFTPVPPSITTQPADQTVNVGDSATFGVVAAGTPSLNYQWKFGGTNILGATNSALTLINVQPTNAGIYSAAVSNLYGFTISSNALLTVLTHPPTIITEPLNQTNFVTTTASFSVTAGGTLPLSYQWSFNTTNILGATNATLTLTNLQLNQAGNYAVAITNAYGSTNSVTVTLTVNPVPSCDPSPSGLANWWRAEGNATDSIGVNNGTLGGTAGFAAGEVGQAFTFDGSSGYVSIPDSPAMDSFTNSMTIELWMKSGQLTANSDWEGIVTKGEGSWRFMGTTFAKTVYFGANGVTPLDITGTRNVNDGQWHHVAAVYDGSTMSLYVDGTLDVSHPATGAISQDSDAVYLGGLVDPPAGHNYSFNGMLDEVSLYHRALTASEIQAIFITGSGGKCVPQIPPTIITEPVSQTNFVSTTASFSVTAGGTLPLRYQWSSNTTNILGATNSTLTLANVQLNQAGNYAVAITNAYGWTNSVTVTLTVNPLPSCDPPPAGLANWWRAEGNASDSIGTNNGTLGGTVGFAAGEVGQAFTFDGSSGYVSIPDSPAMDSFTNSMTIELWMKSGQLTANSDWEGIVTKGQTSWRFMATTFAKTVYIGLSGITPADLFGTRNVNDEQWHHVAAVYDGHTTSLYVDGTLDVSQAATGAISQDSDPVYLGGIVDPPGGHNYSFNGMLDEVSLYHRALTSNEIAAIYLVGRAGKCVSGVPPIITTQPVSETNIVGTTASFSVAVGGIPPFNYQWSFNTTNIAGATNATLALTNVQFSQAGNYAVAITNIYGSTNSAIAVLTVNPLPPCDPPPAGLVNWWRAEGNATDSIGTNNGTLGGTAGFAAGEVGQAFTFDGSSGYVSIPDSPAMDSFTNSMTIELWMKSGQLTANSDWEGIVTKGEGSWRFMGTTFAKTVYFGATGVSPLDITGTRNVNDGQWHHVAAVYDGSTMSLYVDGTLDVSHPATGAISQDSDAVYLGGLVDPPIGHNYSFNGMLDEVSLYHRALTASEIQAIFITGIGGKCVPAAPFITTQPTNQTVAVGNTGGFSVQAGGTPAPSYQWRFNGTNIAGATNTALTLFNAQFTNAGTYSVMVTNTYGKTVSSNAILTVIPNHSFSWDPIPSPRFVNTPFAVTIQARDLTNGILTNFSGTVFLVSTSGVPVNPAISGNFTQGVWVGSITIPQAVTNLVLQAADGSGQPGLANPINVVSLPSLSATPSGSTLYLSWPVSPSGFILETTEGLSPANWVPVDAPPIMIGGQYLEPIELSGTNAFYRLRFPGP